SGIGVGSMAAEPAIHEWLDMGNRFHPEWAIAPGGHLVDEPGERRLAGAAIAEQQDRIWTVGDAFAAALQVLHGGALTPERRYLVGWHGDQSWVEMSIPSDQQQQLQYTPQSNKSQTFGTLLEVKSPNMVMSR